MVCAYGIIRIVGLFGYDSLAAQFWASLLAIVVGNVLWVVMTGV